MEESVGEFNLGNHLDAGFSRRASCIEFRNARAHDNKVGTREDALGVSAQVEFAITQLRNLCFELLGGLAIAYGHSRASCPAKIGNANPGLREPYNNDMLACEIHGRSLTQLEGAKGEQR